MAEIKYAPNDPVFWLHHSFVDMIFESWFDQYPASPLDTPTTLRTYHGSNDIMGGIVPFYSNRDLFHHSSAFGYGYDFIYSAPNATDNIPKDIISSAAERYFLTSLCLLLLHLI